MLLKITLTPEPYLSSGSPCHSRQVHHWQIHATHMALAFSPHNCFLSCLPTLAPEFSGLVSTNSSAVPHSLLLLKGTVLPVPDHVLP